MDGVKATSHGSEASPGATLETAGGVELRFDDFGALDEVVAKSVDVHLEYLSNTGLVMLRIGDLHLDLWTRGTSAILSTVVEP